MSKLAVSAAALILLVFALPVQAQETSFLPDCGQTVYSLNGGKTVLASQYDENEHGSIVGTEVNRKCGVNDFVRIFVNLADWGLTVLAFVAVFFFVWGAFDWIIAAGRQGMIEDGRKKMLGAIVGTLLVLVAWVLVGFWMAGLTGDYEGYVFPNENSKRLWFGAKTGCKDTYTDKCKLETGFYNGCGDLKTTEFGPIAQIQLLLNEHMCSAGTVDGCYGPQTEQAVNTFQASNGIKATGQVDSNTYNILQTTGFDCGIDSTPQLIGCCVPKGVQNSTAGQPCIETIFENACLNTTHGNPTVDYKFIAGGCANVAECTTICTYDPATSCK